MSYVIDQKNCSGCHRCRMECSVGAISFKNDKYWIDPEKCISCGSCEAVCHNGCIADPEQPKIAVPHDRIELSCDVCVIGAGAAGMAAAAKAQDMGASVVILEKNHEIGGSAWYATGFAVHYSRFHQEAGKADTRQEKYAQFLEKTKDFEVDRELLKRLFEANADWVDWLIEEHGLRELYDFNPNAFGPMCLSKKVAPPWNDQRIDAMIGPGGGGWLIPTTLLKDFEAKGGKIFYNAPAVELETGENGAITGVLATDPGGEIHISCKAAVVASGAFTRNREIMDKMQPLFYDDEGKQPVHIFTCSTCTGDGITMCEKLGADVDYENRRVNMFGPMRHPYPGVTLNSGSGPMFRTTGERYHMAFGMTEVSDLAYDPKRYIWKIVDDGNFEANINHKIKQGRDDNGVDLTHFLKDWRTVVAEEAEAGAVVMADSLTELGAKLDFDPVRFAAEIEDYNRELTAPKKPPQGMPVMEMELPASMMGPPAQPIGKGPFYAIKMTMFHENSMGGMVIDKNTAVLKQGSPIPGLFAAGDTTRGVMVPGDVGVQYIEGVFTALTYAFNSGYISGVEAAKFAQK